MATFVADLSDFLIPHISNYTPDFGTMLDRGLQTKEVSENICYPLLAQRGFTVTETSDTTQILRDSVFLMQTADTSLSLASGQEGIKVSVYNRSDGVVTVKCNSDSSGNLDEHEIISGGALQFRYINGKWETLSEITKVEFIEGGTGAGELAGTIKFTFSDGREETIGIYNANGIASFVQTEESDLPGGRNVWEVTLDNGKVIDIITYNGKGIRSWVQTESSTEYGGRNTWEVTTDDGEVIEMSVINGNGIVSVEAVNSTEPLAENKITFTTSDNKTFELISVNGDGITVFEKTEESTEPLGKSTVHMETASGKSTDLTVINGNGIVDVTVENSSEPLAKNTATFTMADGDVKTLESYNGNSVTVFEKTAESTEPLGESTIEIGTADGKVLDLTAINGNGVVSVEQTDSDEKGGENTLTVTWADGTVNKLVARNGVDTVGVESLTQIEASEEPLGKNVWRVVLVDGTTFDLVVYNGDGIVSAEQTVKSELSGGENVMTFTMASGKTAELSVKNGASDDLFLALTIDPNGSKYFSFRGKNYLVGDGNTIMAINLSTLEVEKQSTLSVEDGYVYAGICDTQLDLSGLGLSLDDEATLFGFIGEKGKGLLTQRVVSGEPFIGNLTLQASFNQEGLNIEEWS